MLGGMGRRPEQEKALVKLFQLAELEWVTSERNQIAPFSKVATSINPGRFDFCIVITKFISHMARETVTPHLNRAGIPIIYLRGSYNPTSITESIKAQLPELPPLAEPSTPVELDTFGPAEPLKAAPSHSPNPFIDGFRKLQKKGVAPPETRKRAIGWIANHEEAGFAPFAREFPYTDLDYAFWSSILRTLQHERLVLKANTPSPKEETMANRHTKVAGQNLPFDPETDSGKVKKYLLNMNDEELRASKYAKYMEDTGHNVARSLFSNAKFVVMKHRKSGGKKQTAAPASRLDIATNGRAAYSVAAEVDLSQFSTIPYPTLKAFAKLLADSLLQSAVSIVRLADPDAMEIRVAG